MIKELKSTTLAQRLEDHQLETIAKHCQQEFFQAGQQVCAADDVLDRLYIVVDGCFKGVIHSQSGERTKLFVNAGEVLGQYSLLFNETALADIHAEFDTTTLTVDRATFLELLEQIPQLREILGQSFRARIKHALHGDKAHRFARNLLFVYPSCSTNSIPIDVANELARRGEKVAYVGDQQSDEPNVVTFSDDGDQQLELKLASPEFDRVIVETRSQPSADFSQRLRFANEIFWMYLGNSPVEMQRQLDEVFDQSPSEAAKIKRICLLDPGQLYAPQGLVDNRLHRRDFIMPAIVAGSDRRLYLQGIGRLARHLSDVKLGLALAGGGARGLVHFGVLRALDRAGISFDLMSGTSAGAMFGLSYATGLDTDFMLNAYHQSLTPGFPFKWMPKGDVWFLIWKYRSRGWDKMLRSYFSCDFEQLQIPFYAVTVDLVRGQQVIRESGDIIHAMLESLNLPFIAKPVLKDGMALVDGGILNNLPGSLLTQHGADYVVGVNVSAELNPQFGKNRPGMATSEMKNVGSLDTLFRMLEVMGKGTSETQRAAVDFLLTPDTSSFSFTDFTQGAGLAEVGEAVVEAALPELQESIRNLMKFKRN